MIWISIIDSLFSSAKKTEYDEHFIFFSYFTSLCFLEKFLRPFLVSAITSISPGGKLFEIIKNGMKINFPD